MLFLEAFEILDFKSAWKFFEKNFFDESAANQFTTSISK